MRDMIAYCGLDCEKCDAYLATINDDQALREKTAKLWSEWVKFPTTAEELKKVFERIWIGAKDDFGQTYAEWFNTDYDCYVDGLYDLLGEYANLDELNYLASKLDDMS